MKENKKNYTPWVEEFFPPVISLREFFSFEISLQDIFFWSHPYGHTPPPLPLKSQMVGHLLGLCQPFLPHVGADCVKSQKNICMRAGG